MKKSIIKTVLLSSFCAFLLISCSEEQIFLLTPTASFDELNTCDSGDIENGTLFTFTIPYEPVSNRSVAELDIEIIWSSERTDRAMITDFMDTGTEIIYSRCFNFDDETSFEVISTARQDNGSLTGGVSVQVQRPDGANFTTKGSAESN